MVLHDTCNCLSEETQRAIELAKNGRVDEALDIACGVEGRPCCRAKAALAVALVTKQLNHFEDARAAATYITDDDMRARFMSVIDVTAKFATS